MATHTDATLFQHFWCSCISPPAAWGHDGHYPACFSVIAMTISALFWYKLGQTINFEEPLLFFLPHKIAQTIRGQLAGCRAVLSQHAEPHAVARKIIAAKPAAGPQVPCPICGSAGKSTVEVPKSGTAAPAAAPGECPAVTQSRTILTTARNRCIGGYHATIATVLALSCVLFDESLKHDKAKSTSPLFTITGVTTGGYFLWDLFVILTEWGPGSIQWLVHAVISALLLFEASTPFFSVRYLVLKAGAAEERVGKIVHVLFVVSFFFVRLVYGCLFLFPELWVSLHRDPVVSTLPLARKILYYVWMPLFAFLQFFWFAQMLFFPKGNGKTKKQ